MLMSNPAVAQWSTLLGRMDALCAVMSLSGFSVNPRQKQHQWAKDAMGCLKKFPDMSINISPDVPDHTGFERIKADWSQHCPDAKEDVPEDMPEPTMEAMRITVFVDANHAHDEKNKFKVGDDVKIIESKPYSKMKRWKVVE